LLGTLLLLLPGIWIAIRSIFSATIVVLEGRSARDSIRRSFDLTRGQFWRLFGLLALIALFTFCVMFGVFFVGGLAGGLGDMDEGRMVHVVEAVINLLTFGLVTPAFGIAMVLLYYDQRVRRESYDAQALSEDLMR
jgi:membrane-anchored glycerophosphoryl diester phosphodiesterase (GDPDase)